jgi:hypothetical protein
VPLIIDQTIQLLNKIPDWLAASQANLEQFETIAKQRRLPIDLTVISSQINANIQNLVQQLALRDCWGHLLLFPLLVLLKALSMRSRAASQVILYQLSLFPMTHLQIKGATGTETGGVKNWFSFRSPMFRL